MAYGYEEDPYSAQVMLQDYRPQAGSWGSPGYLGDYLGESMTPEQGAELLAVGGELTTAFLQSIGGSKPPECKKPIGFMLWRKSRKDAWRAGCEAALRRVAGDQFDTTVAPPPPEFSPPASRFRPSSQSAGASQPDWVVPVIGAVVAVGVIAAIAGFVTTRR